MKRYMMAAAAAALLISSTGCQERSRGKVDVFRLADGRIAYHNDSDDVWFYYYITQVNQGPPESRTSGGINPPGNSWTRGPAPTDKELAEAEETEMDVNLDSEGDPQGSPGEANEGGNGSGDSMSQDGEGGGGTADNSAGDSGGSSGGDSGGSSGGDGGGGDGGGGGE